MRLNKFVGYGAFFLAFVAVGFGMMQVRPAQASTLGVANPDTGYYDATAYPDWDRRFMFMDGIPYGWTPTGTTVDQFVQSAHDYLYNQGPNAVIHQQEWSDVRASVMINAMMGVQTNDPRLGPPSPTRYLNGIALAKQLFTEWETIVRAYDRKDPLYGGSVDFNVPNHAAAATDQNFSGIGDDNTTNVGVPGLAPRGTAHGDYPDAVYAQLGQPEIQPTIIFTNRDGSQFMIKKWCGNMIGDITPFPQDWQHVPSITSPTPNNTPLSSTLPTTLSFTGTAQNVRPQQSPGGTLIGMMSITPPGQASVESALTAPTQFLPLNQNEVSAPLNFNKTVLGGTASGTQFCFWTRVIPATSSGNTADSGRLCYTVQFNNYPSIQGLSGDIHAGGKICNLPAALQPAKDVTGNVNAPSMGEYVIAATGAINNFTSGGGGTLNIGTNGQYTRACRPNLLQTALDGQATSGGTIINSTAPFDLGANTGPGKPQVYYFNGDVTLYGFVRSKVTIVTIGKVNIIPGPANIGIRIDSSQYPSARDLPSLGVIAQGDIIISPAVTRVDAYLFSNGTIDTCDPNSTVGSTCATPQLQINGFLMANKLLFNRLGPFGSSGSQVSEKIKLNPQLYLNPPMFFDEITNGTLQAQGEQPPLY